MKQLFSLFMVLMLVAGVIGCGATVPANNTGAEPVGAYENAESPEVSDEIASIAARATAKLIGASYEPVALISTQLVNGTNYKLLCTQTVPGKDGAKYVILTVYNPLQGESEVISIEGSDAELTGKELAGGWTAAESPIMTEEAQKAFDTAVANKSDVSYRPIALVATQVVAGINYCILCESTIEGENPQSVYQLISVYADLTGDAQITDAVSFIAE